jgi:hypothetical protein
MTPVNGFTDICQMGWDARHFSTAESATKARCGREMTIQNSVKETSPDARAFKPLRRPVDLPHE